MSRFKKTQIYSAVYGCSSWHDLHAVNGHACHMCLLNSELPDIICMCLVGTTLLLFISHHFHPSQLPDAVNSLHCDTRHGNPLPALPLHTHKQRVDKVNQLTALEPLHLWYQALLALLNLINVLRLNWYCNHQCYDAISSRSQTVYINGFCTGLVIWLICHCVFFFLFFSDQDGAEPSANSVSAMNLLRLSHLTGRQDWIQRSQELLIAFSDRLTKVPIALPDMVRSVMAQHYTLKQVTGP